VLGNNATIKNGGSIDSAINAINTQLQASSSPTLQGIVAFKQTINGQDVIGFEGATAFQVTSGTTTSGMGIGSQGTSVASTQAAGGANQDITTAQGAENAINALTAAVALFGTAQAAVGRGENNLNYAVSLASSQLTNEASAESTIKDANLAQQAANLSKAQILTQAGVAALAQANSAPQTLLKLLQ
jgi:flagellin